MLENQAFNYDNFYDFFFNKFKTQVFSPTTRKISEQYKDIHERMNDFTTFKEVKKQNEKKQFTNE